jgi:hypothetical protein
MGYDLHADPELGNARRLRDGGAQPRTPDRGDGAGTGPAADEQYIDSLLLSRELGTLAGTRSAPAVDVRRGRLPKRKEVVIGAEPANPEVRTLVHELEHALGLGYA